MTRPSRSRRSSRTAALRARAAHRARRASARLRAGAEAGMTTAEYAVGTVAACSFAALLFTILHSSAVQAALTGLITRALGMA
jgi:hypothetical protein